MTGWQWFASVVLAEIFAVLASAALGPFYGWRDFGCRMLVFHGLLVGFVVVIGLLGIAFGEWVPF